MPEPAFAVGRSSLPLPPGEVVRNHSQRPDDGVEMCLMSVNVTALRPHASHMVDAMCSASSP
eukprot:6108181-Alexandrium_andersonii.AAC.1